MNLRVSTPGDQSRQNGVLAPGLKLFQFHDSTPQAVHRSRESPACVLLCSYVAGFTEIVVKSVAYKLSVRAHQLLFPVMSLSGSQFLSLH